jgi:hypothetical protein
MMRLDGRNSNGRRSHKKCCCSWSDCREISKAMKGKDDVWGVGDFVVVIMKKQKSNRQARLSENWARNLHCSEVSTYTVARHHFPRQLLSPVKKWTNPLPASEAEACGITGDENVLVDENGAKGEIMFVRAPIMKRHIVRAAAKMPRERFSPVEITSASVKELKNLFFSEDGKLRASLVKDIDCTVDSGHGFITLGQADTEDRRWMIPFKVKKSGEKSATFLGVEKIVKNFINLEEERILGIVMIIGGTMDQPIHHDVARKFTEESESVEDYVRYYIDMKSPYAPSSVLIDMSERNEVKIGIQRDQVYHVPSDWSKCTIAKSGATEYEIIRENEKLVVIAVPFGCIFTGDFQHAGVSNVKENSAEHGLLKSLMSQLVPLMSMENYTERMNRVLKVLMECKGIQSVCRFHCSTEKLGSKFEIGSNYVGYTDCNENRLEGRLKME